MSEFGEPWCSRAIWQPGYEAVGTAWIEDRTGERVKTKEQLHRAQVCVNALAGLSEEQIASIDWSKVPDLVKACKSIRDRLVNSAIPIGDELRLALAAVERK